MSSTRIVGGRLILVWALCSVAIGAGSNVEASAQVMNPLPNFGEVTPRLYRGGAPDRSGVQYLAQHEFNTVVDLRLRYNYKELHDCDRMGMRYISLPLTPVMTPSKEVIGRFLKIAGDSRYGKIYVHCLAGGDRTGVMVALYRILYQHWSYKQAEAEMHKYNFRPWLSTFLQTVSAYSQGRGAYPSPRVITSTSPKGSNG